MSETVFHQLRERLDSYSMGYPKTESGVEMKILKKIFSAETAALFLQLGLTLETPESVAGRTGRDPVELSEKLEQMARDGLLFRHRKHKTVRYSAVPFMVGFYEYQLGKMDRELAELTETFFKEGMNAHIANSMVPLRTIPVNEAIEATMQIAPYSDARKILQAASRIAVARCICRVQQEKLGEACEKPQEVCFSFGSHADYYVENGLGRYIDLDEGLTLLARSEQEGLVAQPASSVNPGGMCNCCGDCCGILRALKATPKPAELVMNNYFAAVDYDACTGCETCLDRCQMAAVSLNAAGLATIQPQRCIGCGLCVTTCPGDAIRMALKPEAEQRPIPASAMELAIKTATIRGLSPFPKS
ncbi:4Fe-4S binding protein [bacterium]|nr:4Fe-4S binding protein [bacterium]